MGLPQSSSARPPVHHTISSRNAAAAAATTTTTMATTQILAVLATIATVTFAQGPVGMDPNAFGAGMDLGAGAPGGGQDLFGTLNDPSFAGTGNLDMGLGGTGGYDPALDGMAGLDPMGGTGPMNPGPMQPAVQQPVAPPVQQQQQNPMAMFARLMMFNHMDIPPMMAMLGGGGGMNLMLPMLMFGGMF